MIRDIGDPPPAAGSTVRSSTISRSSTRPDSYSKSWSLTFGPPRAQRFDQSRFCTCRASVDGQDQVARLEPGPVGGGAGRYVGDPDTISPVAGHANAQRQALDGSDAGGLELVEQRDGSSPGPVSRKVRAISAAVSPRAPSWTSAMLAEIPSGARTTSLSGFWRATFRSSSQANSLRAATESASGPARPRGEPRPGWSRSAIARRRPR